MARLKIKRPPGKKAPRSKRSLVLKILLALLAIPVIAAAAFLIRYYYLFDGIIEQKLALHDFAAQTKIYAGPALLAPGKHLSCSELIDRLRQLGYEDDASGGCYYQVRAADRLLIHNDGSVPGSPNRTVEIRCAGKTIRALRDPERQTEMPQFALKPELLSNAIDKSREKRRYVTYQEMPRVLVDAVLAAEDRRFFNHGGIDPVRILKALIVDVRERDVAQGASTLTQQFVKNYFLTPERTWKRKLTDAYMSILLEQRLSKEQIFELYGNEVYLGQAGSFSIVGFGKAADAFFGKNIRDLTLEEAATIAGIIPLPNRYTPLRYKDRALARRNLVLDQMAEFDMITPRERDAAKAKSLSVKPASFLNYSDAPYFVDYVQGRLLEKYGESSQTLSRLRVYTSLDPGLQQAAFEAIETGTKELDAHFAKAADPVAPGTVQASLIAVDPRNGHILAMVGGRNYGSSQFNRIIQSRRQPGSIFKPFVYAAALETAYHSATPLTAVSTILDQPTQFTFEDTEYQPRNFKEEYLGQVTMRQAITRSLNIPTIKLAETIGYARVAELAHRLGLNEQIKPYPAMAIGSFEITPLEMVRAYTAFANGGLLSELSAVLEVRDDTGNRVFVAQPKTKDARTPQTAFLVTSLLQSVIDHGTGYGARQRGFTLPAAGKTGTSHDGWFAGYTPELLCIVWVGFDDNRELGLSGSQAALPIWTNFMKKAANILPLRGEQFVEPEDVVQVEVDPTTGLLATPNCMQHQMEYFIKGTEPVVKCYGNNYAHFSGSGGGLGNIYATPSNETHSGADNE